MKIYHIALDSSFSDCLMLLARDYPRVRRPALAISFLFISSHTSPSRSLLESNSIHLIMKHNPFLHSKHLQPSPKRRRIDPGSASSHQASRPGFIDQRLVEGAQWPGYPDLVQQRPSSIPTSTLSGHEEDVHLDAFGNQLRFAVWSVANTSLDLELLAQQKNMCAIQSSNFALFHPSPEQDILPGLKHQDVLPQKSRFFDCKCPIDSSQPKYTSTANLTLAPSLPSHNASS